MKRLIVTRIKNWRWRIWADSSLQSRSSIDIGIINVKHIYILSSEASQSQSRWLNSSSKSDGTNDVLQSGQVIWWWSIQRSRQFRWKICLQFFKHLISSSPPSKSYKQTAQFSGRSPPASAIRSENFTTGRNSRIRIAAIGGRLRWMEGVSCKWNSDGRRKSEMLRKLIREMSKFFM